MPVDRRINKDSIDFFAYEQPPACNFHLYHICQGFDYGGRGVEQHDGGDHDDVDNHDPSSKMRSAFTSTNTRPPKNPSSPHRRTKNPDSEIRI